MRRVILLALVLCGLTTFVKAQNNLPFSVSYQGDVQLGYSIGVGTFNYDRINLHLINSAKLGDYFSTGIGLGIDCYTSIGYDDSAEVALPIYLKLRGYLPVNEKTSLFASMDIGASIGLSDGLSDLNGLLFVPAVGAKFYLNPKNAITLSLGYNLQKWSAGGIASLNTDALQLKVGYSF